MPFPTSPTIGDQYITSSGLTYEFQEPNVWTNITVTGVQSVTGDGVAGTPENPVLSFPDADEVDDSGTTNKFATETELNQIGTNETNIGNKENTITGGTTAQYWRGDKSFQTLDKSAVDLANVDNTSDANKEVSVPTATALGLKADKDSLVRVNGNVTGFINTATNTWELNASASGSEPFVDSDDNPYLTFAIQNGVWDAVDGNVNLLLSANDFANATWNTRGVTINSNAITSPDGTSNADEIIISTTNVVHSVYQTSVANDDRTQSLYVKYNGNIRYIQLSSGVTTVQYTNFDILEGVIGSQGTQNIFPKIESLPDGWFRISASLKISSVCEFIIVDALDSDWRDPFLGTLNDSVYFWFAKLEEGQALTGGVPIEIEKLLTESQEKQNRKGLADYLQKYEYKTVDENNQLTVVMIGDSIFGRQDISDGLSVTTNQAIGEFPPNMIYKNIAWGILERYQFNNADVEYINLSSVKWSSQGTWSVISNIDNIQCFDNSVIGDYQEITITGSKFFKLVFTTLGGRTLTGVDVTVNGFTPSSLGLVGIDSITGGTTDIKWGSYIWSGLDEGTNYTFRFTKTDTSITSIWGCETWSKPRLNVINNGHGGTTADAQAFRRAYASNQYYSPDLIIYEMPVLNDAYTLSLNGGDSVTPTSSRKGGTTEFYFVRALEDGTYTNFDNLVMKAGEIASINNVGVYELGSVKYDQEKNNYITGLNTVIDSQSFIGVPILCSTVHRTFNINENDRFWGYEYLKYSRYKATDNDTAFVDVYNYCIENSIDPDSITSDTTHLNTLGVSTWLDVLFPTLDLRFNKTEGGGKNKFKESGTVLIADSRDVVFSIKYKTPPKVSISQIGGNNIYIDSIDEFGFTVNGAGDFDWITLK